MPVFRVDDPTDSRIADYATVRDADLLRVRGLFVAEGRLVVKRLLGCSTLRVRSLLLTEAAYTSIASELPAVDNLPIYIGDLTLFRLITGFNIHRGCLALAERPGEIKVADIVASAERLVILEDIADADNVGAVFRNAAAFGADGVLLSPTCCDPLYRKAIRTSVGAALQVKFGRLADWLSELSDLKRAGFQTIALTPSQDAIDLATLDPLQYPRIALIFGNEGSGLQPGTEALAGLRATIRMRAHHDSLNVATAAGIAMHRMFARANV